MKRRKFDEDKVFLEGLSKDFIQSFGKIGFTKRNKCYMPVLCVSPYDVDGNLKAIWFRKNREQKQKSLPLFHLISWYGKTQSRDKYGWIVDFLTYERAKEQQCHDLPEHIRDKLEKKLPLSSMETFLVQAFEELERALALKNTEQKKVVESAPRLDVVLMAEHMQNDVILMPNQMQDGIGANKDSNITNVSELEQKENIQRGTETETGKALLNAKQKKVLKREPRLDLILMPEQNRDKDVTNVSEREQKQNVQGGSNGKRIGKPAKKGEVNKQKMIRSDDFAGKAVTLVSSKEEQEFFLQNEQDLIPVLFELQDCLKGESKKTAQSCLETINDLVPSITPSFVEQYCIVKLLKRTGKRFPDLCYQGKVIVGNLKNVYEMKTALREKTFEVTWKGLFTDLLRKPENSQCPASPANDDLRVPKKAHCDGALIKEDVVATIQNIKSVVGKRRPDMDHMGIKPAQKKAKFTLSELITGKKPTVHQLISPKQSQSLQESKEEEKIPDWLLKIGLDVPENLTDKRRLLGREFVDAVIEEWPQNIINMVNTTAFVLNTEQAVYVWAQKPYLDYKKKRIEYPESYHIKIREVVSGLAGRNETCDDNYVPELVKRMMQGTYRTAMDLVNLPPDDFYNSMTNAL